MLLNKFPITHLKDLLNLQQSKLINIFRLWGGYSLTPIAAVFYLTFRCNLNCKMCFQAGERKSYIQWGGEEQEFKRIKQVIDNLLSFPVKPRIHFHGGEPLLYKDLNLLLEYLRKRHVKWSLTTNGFYLDNFAETIVTNKPSNINVSIDGTQEIHNKLRGNSQVFQKAMAGIKAINSLRKEKRSTYPRIAVNCAILPTNLYHLEDIIMRIENSGADILTFEHLYFDKKNKQTTDMAQQINIDYLKNQIKKIQSTKYSIPVKFFPKIKISDIDAYYHNLSHNFGNKCIAPWLIVRVYPNGEIRPCIFGNPIGNLTEKPLHKLWNNRQIRNFRKKIITNGISNYKCDRCCHRQYYA
jgi:radical SAM protein with 4Fe4S-binding SPASM domain